MSIIAKIIAEAIDDNTPVTSLLRKCLVLAHELKNERLKTWVSGELYGFSDGALAPAYRTFPVQSVGDFVGPIHLMGDQPLQASAMKADWIREFAQSVTITESIASIQSLLGTERSSFSLPWSADLVMAHEDVFLEGMTLLRARRVVPRSRVIQIVDTVRNKVLEFALELKDEVGDADSGLDAIPQEQVERYVTQNFYGDNNIVGSTVHGGSAQASRGGVTQGDFASLGAALLGQNVSATDVAALKEALALDASIPATDAQPGPATRAWITRVAATIAAAGKGIVVQVAERGLLALIKVYLGL